MRLRSSTAGTATTDPPEPIAIQGQKRRRRSSPRVSEPVKRSRRSQAQEEQSVAVSSEQQSANTNGTTEVAKQEEADGENISAVGDEKLDLDAVLASSAAELVKELEAAAAEESTVQEDIVERTADQTEEDMSNVPLVVQPREWLRAASLPLLDQLVNFRQTPRRYEVDADFGHDQADQILECVGNCTPKQLNNLYAKPHLDSSLTWREWATEFVNVKRLYSRDEHYIDAYDTAENHIIAKKSNLATAILAVLRPQDGDFLRLHKRFMDVFLPPEEPLANWQADLYYQVKLRLYGYGARLPEDLRVQLINELFPADIDTILWRRYPRAAHAELSEPEVQLASLCQLMRHQLLPEGSIITAEQQQDWETCLISIQPQLREFARRRVDYLRGQKSNTSSYGFTASSNMQGSTSNDYPSNYGTVTNFEEDFDRDDMVRRAALAAHAALRGANLPDTSETPLLTETEQFATTTLSYAPVTTSQAHGKEREKTHDYVHDSTSAQYQKARLEATAKAASKARAGANLTPSQRRPWSREEENALMTGLDRVKGPHWSQILTMYGPGGTVSDVLKDRNQVQLKDKARNLKLFFLKSGHEVPAYLKHVTGELKTRAPAQAARNETIDRLEESGSEDKATHDAITALAAGPRDDSVFGTPNGANSNTETRMSSDVSRASLSEDEQDDEQENGHEQREETDEQREQRRSENDKEMGEAIETALQAIGNPDDAPTSLRTRRGLAGLSA